MTSDGAASHWGSAVDHWLATIGSSRTYVAFSIGGALIALALTPSMTRREALLSLFGNIAVAVFASPGALAWLMVHSEPARNLLHGLMGLIGVSVARGLLRFAKTFETDPLSVVRHLILQRIRKGCDDDFRQ